VTGPDDAAVRELLRVCGVPARREPRSAPALARLPAWRLPSTEGTIAAWRLGTGPAVLLVHGWEDDHSLWSPLVDVLAARGRALVAFDMPAHGRSDGVWGLHPEAVDAVHTVAAALGPVDAVVAHSSGAGAAMLAVAEGLPVARAVLVAPPLRGGNRWLRYARRLGMPDEVAAEAQRRYDARTGPARASFALRRALAELALPLLVVHSTDDERMPFRDSEETVAECASATLVTATGLDHRRTARDPTVVARIADFVAPTA
jgi:pimeloyl-ACP methyl ester carboxylesterase